MPPSPRFILSAQYFLYFGALGIALPYFNLYLHRIGFDGAQIGIISALRSAAMVIFPILWSLAADRFQARKPIYIGCGLASALMWALYLFTADFTTIAVITVFYAIFFAPLIAFLEAFTMDALGREKRRYGRVRAWGTMAFIVMVTLVGRLIEAHSIRIILYLILIGMLLQWAFSLKIPAGERTPRTGGFLRNMGAFLSRRSAVFLLAAFLMLVSHGAYYGFFSIHLEALGYGGTFIGAAWALASVAEMAVMVNSQRIFDRVSLERALLLAFGMAAIRWGALAMIEGPVAILLCQGLHAFTYALFHIAGILFIDQLAPGGAKTVGQSVNNAVTYGLGMMVGFFASGFLYERIGAPRLFMASAGVALLGGAILMVCFFKNKSSPSYSREIT